jgi:hypothetical protein
VRVVADARCLANLRATNTTNAAATFKTLIGELLEENLPVPLPVRCTGRLLVSLIFYWYELAFLQQKAH